MKFNKKVIFFDGDGTLWYPKKTKYSKHPVWVYKDRRIKDYLNHIVMIPSVLSVIKKLKQMGIITVILSTNPSPPEIADIHIKHKVKHFKLDGLFDEVYATRPYPESKVEFMLKILKRRKIKKSNALMIGDSYKWDYEPAKNNGIDALLIKSKYMHEHEAVKSVKRKINKLSDLLKYI